MQKLLKQIQQQQDAIRSFTESDKAILRYAREAIEPLQNIRKMMIEQMEATQKSMRPFQESIERILLQQEVWTKSIRGIMEEVPKRMRKVQEYLFERGWYLGPDAAIPGIQMLVKMIDDGRHDQIEEEMQSWAEIRIDEISKEIGTTFRLRRPIIEDALAAHRDGKYTLSVPVLFAQADGLANEIIGSFLFCGKPKRAFENLLVSLEPFSPDSALNAMVTPLRSHSTLGEKPKHPIPGSEQGHANRDEVLHGASTNYAIKANSLRIISLIDYLLGIRDVLNSHKDWAKKWRKEFKEALAVADKASGSGKSGPVDGKAH